MDAELLAKVFRDERVFINICQDFDGEVLEARADPERRVDGIPDALVSEHAGFFAVIAVNAGEQFGGGSRAG